MLSVLDCVMEALRLYPLCLLRPKVIGVCKACSERLWLLGYGETGLCDERIP